MLYEVITHNGVPGQKHKDYPRTGDFADGLTTAPLFPSAAGCAGRYP